MAQLNLVSLSRFLRVGLAAAVSEYALFVLLHRAFAVPLLLAHALSFLLGLAISFSLNRTWTFRPGSTYKFGYSTQLVLYASLAVINLGLGTIIISSVHALGIATLLSKLIAMGGIAAWNFIIMRLFVFSERSQQ